MMVAELKTAPSANNVARSVGMPHIGYKQGFSFTPHWNSFWVELCRTKTCYSANRSVLYTEFRNINFEIIQWAVFKIIEAKGGRLVKKWEFGQTEKILIYQFFKTRIYAFMIHGQFLPKSSSNWRFVIQDSRVWCLQPRPCQGLEPLNLGWQISNLIYF